MVDQVRTVTTESFAKAAHQGDVAVVALGLAEGIDSNDPGKTGSTPLEWAAMAKHHSVMKILLDAGANPNGAAPTDSQSRPATPLAHAITNADVAAIEMLIDAKADVNALHRYPGGATHTLVCMTLRCAPSFLWEEGGEASLNQVLGRLIDGDATVGHAPGTSTSALHEAICSRVPVSTVAMLIEHGADRISMNERGNRVIHEAAEKGRVDVIELLAASGSSVDAWNQSGQTAAFCASNAEVLKCVLALGADVAAQDNRGTSLLLSEVMKMEDGTQEIPSKVAVLVRAGADPGQADNVGNSARSLARSRGFSLLEQLFDAREAAALFSSTASTTTARPTGV